MSILIQRFLVAAVCLFSMAKGADEFPPPGFTELSSDTSPMRSFKIIHYKRDPNDFSSDSQIWLQGLQPEFKTQLLFTHNNRAWWLISDDEDYIAINYHEGSTDGLLHIFVRGKDGIYTEKKKEYRDVAQKLMTTQLKLKKMPDFDHLYCYGTAWLRNGVLLAHLNGHYSGENYLEEWYFLYDVKNDRFSWDLSKVNQGAFSLVKHPESRK